jgi:hypothetical protein
VTYGGHPLYFYAHEAKNEVKCHNIRGFGGLWLVVTLKGEHRTLTSSPSLVFRYAAVRVGLDWVQDETRTSRHPRQCHGLPAALGCRAGHPVVRRPADACRERKLGELESPPPVVLDVRRVRCMEMAGRVVRIDDREPGAEQCRTDAAALSVGMDAEGLQVPDRLVRERPLKSGP